MSQKASARSAPQRDPTCWLEVETASAQTFAACKRRKLPLSPKPQAPPTVLAVLACITTHKFMMVHVSGCCETAWAVDPCG